MEPLLIVILSVIGVTILIVVLSGVKVIRQSYQYVIERMGAYKETWSVGIHYLVPFIDRISKKVNMKEQLIDYDPQPVITKDNVTMQIDTVIYYKITDSKLYSYGVEHPMNALEALTATTLRNIIGDIELDETLTSRDLINSKMREILDIATDPWGIKVTRVELKNILPPKDIRESMEKQMRAEREKRQTILIAEGDKQARILDAEGKANSSIISAEGEKRSKVLHAEGEAEALLTVQRAQAEAIKLLRLADPNSAVLTLKKYEALAKVADGRATKIFLPNDLGSAFSSVLTVAESMKQDVVDISPSNKPVVPVPYEKK